MKDLLIGIVLGVFAVLLTFQLIAFKQHCLDDKKSKIIIVGGIDT